MNKEYIEREIAISLIDEVHTEANNLCMPDDWKANYAAGLQVVKKIIKHITPADVVEVKHGAWIKKSTCVYECSLCVGVAFMDFNGKPCCYCPSCGAKMDLKEGA